MSNRRYKTVSNSILARAYNVSAFTFRKWIKPIKDKLSPYPVQAYTPKQVAMIVELLGEPEYIDMIATTPSNPINPKTYE